MAFAWFLLQMLLAGEYSYRSMSNEKIVSATSNPIKYYFGIVWCSVMLVVSGIFAFFAKRKYRSVVSTHANSAMDDQG